MANAIIQVKDILEKALNEINEVLNNIGARVITEPIETNPEYIINSICDFFDIKRKDLTMNCRIRELIVKRKLTVYLLRKHTNLTLQQIAYTLNYKNHATDIHHLIQA